MKEKKAIIIGAGPAGLTAAYELLKRTNIKPQVFEMDSQVGGLAKTINYKGNRIDIGGHRFFSKSDRVMNWWQSVLPFQYQENGEQLVDPAKTDSVMMRRQRLSRIYYLRSFFDYPVSLNKTTLGNLGVRRICRIVSSYAKIRLFPLKKENSLEDFFINRFGRELYETFFKDYTHKVWGIPASAIKPEWGAQRIKGISISKVIANAFKSVFVRRKKSLKKVETSWIDRFWYPKFGPGQIWEVVTEKVTQKGGSVSLRSAVTGLSFDGKRITAVTVRDAATGQEHTLESDYVFSTMPISELIEKMHGPVPENVRQVSSGLKYRDFITVGLLLKKMNIRTRGKVHDMVPDNWVYIQEPEVKVGRVQIFNNWSPYMVKDPETVWIGLEYFANDGDELWSMSEEEFKQFAIDEMVRIEMIQKEDVIDAVVAKIPKAYPVYFGSYDRFHEIQTFTNTIENLFLIGRNGMHKYNNQDHSMLAAMVAVDNIVGGITTKENIWKVNTEKEYHEGS